MLFSVSQKIILLFIVILFLITCGIGQSTIDSTAYDEVSFPFTGNESLDYTKQANDMTDKTPGEEESLATSTRASVGFVIKEPGHGRVNSYY